MKVEHLKFRSGVAGVRAGEAGPPVILLHPIGLASQTWRNVQPMIADGCRTLALDLLGFGASEKPADADYSLQAQAARVLDAADELEWDEVSLVGNSLGGGVSLATAIEAPERVQSLALIGTVGYPTGMPPLRLLAEVPPLERVVRLTSRAAAPWILRYCLADPARLERKAVGEYARVLTSPEGTRAFRLTSRAIYGASLAQLVPHYRSIHCPVLLLHGDRDPIIRRWVPERLCHALPNAELRWLHGVGHFPQEEDPRQLLEHLVPFLLRRDAVAV